jgi:hypothetical protein
MTHYCKQCLKQYSSYQSWWNHNKKFHISKTIKSNHLGNHLVINNNQESPHDNRSLQCKFCNKLFTHKNNRWRHEKTCKEKEKREQMAEMEREIDQKQLQIQLKKEEARILKLQLKLEKSKRKQPKTVNELNNLLTQHRNNINRSLIQNHSNNNNTINNIHNHYQIIGFGKEQDIPALLTNNEKKTIIRSKFNSLQKLIEIVHCGNYNQFKNVIITNMKDNYMYKLDDSKGIFVLAPKDEVISSLINYRIDDLVVIYNEFVEQNNIDEKTKERMEDFINTMSYGNEHDKKYQINEIKLLLFNNKDKISDDISLMLTVNEVD